MKTIKRKGKTIQKADRRVGISFEVTAIIERKDGGVRYFSTSLRHYSTGATITILGKPWPVGTKVDFFEK